MKKIFAVTAFAAAVFTMASCDHLDDTMSVTDPAQTGKVAPTKVAESGFQQQIPSGTDVWGVEWDFEGTYWEVEYKTGTVPNVTEYTMYLDLDGNWLATKTEVFIRNVPQNIMEAFTASEYGTSVLDDEGIDYFQTPTGEFYRFEIEIKGRDAEVDVDLNGNVTFVGYDN